MSQSRPRLYTEKPLCLLSFLTCKMMSIRGFKSVSLGQYKANTECTSWCQRDPEMEKCSSIGTVREGLFLVREPRAERRVRKVTESETDPSHQLLWHEDHRNWGHWIGIWYKSLMVENAKEKKPVAGKDCESIQNNHWPPTSQEKQRLENAHACAGLPSWLVTPSTLKTNPPPSSTSPLGTVFLETRPVFCVEM